MTVWNVEGDGIPGLDVCRELWSNSWVVDVKALEKRLKEPKFANIQAQLMQPDHDEQTALQYLLSNSYMRNAELLINRFPLAAWIVGSR